MIIEQSSPDTTCIVPLSDGAEWKLLDTDFITDPGTNAFGFANVINNLLPFVDGYSFTAIGKVFVVDNTLPFNTSQGLSFNSQGSPLQVAILIQSILENCFLNEYTFSITSLPSTTLVSFVANDNEVKDNFINQGDINGVTAFGINGNDPEYSDSRITSELICHDGETLKPVLHGSRTQKTKIINGVVQETCFDFKGLIASQLKGNCPNLTQGPELVTGWQKKFCIRYKLEIPDENCIYQESEWTYTEPSLFARMIKQCNDNRGTSRFCGFDISYLNEHVSDCFSGKWAVLGFSGNLNCFNVSLFNIQFSYVVCTNIPSLGVTDEFETTIEDGLILIPVGDYNLSRLGYDIPAGESYTVQLKARAYLNGNPLGDTTLTEVFTFTKSVNSCPSVQVFWEEDCGMISSMCFDYLDSIDLTTEGKKVCVGKLKNTSFLEKLKKSKYSVIKNKSFLKKKLKIKKKNSRRNHKELNDFLGSEKYWVIEKDINDNDVVVEVIPDFGTTGLYKKGELLEIVFTYSLDEKLTFSTC